MNNNMCSFKAGIQTDSRPKHLLLLFLSTVQALSKLLSKGFKRNLFGVQLKNFYETTFTTPVGLSAN